MTAEISEDQKKEVFRVLVETQDGGTAVAESRQQVATKFDLEVTGVVAIEREGVANSWPPLDAQVPAPKLSDSQTG